MPIDNSVAKCIHGSHSECALCGEVAQPEPEDCPVCKGSGQVLWRVLMSFSGVKTRQYKDCPECGGDGKVEK